MAQKLLVLLRDYYEVFGEYPYLLGKQEDKSLHQIASKLYNGLAWERFIDDRPVTASSRYYVVSSDKQSFLIFLELEHSKELISKNSETVIVFDLNCASEKIFCLTQETVIPDFGEKISDEKLGRKKSQKIKKTNF